MDEIAAVPAGAPAVRRARAGRAGAARGGGARSARSPHGETIFAQGAAPQTSVWIVRAASVELVDHGRVLDLLGPGELFGFASMLAELPTGFAARAARRDACYRLPGDVTRPLLARPEGLPLRHAHAPRPPGGGVAAPGRARARAAGRRRCCARPPVRCAPDTPIATAAARDDRHGPDVRGRRPAATAASGSSPTATCARASSPPALPPDAPSREVMSAPAYTVAGDRLGRRGARRDARPRRPPLPGAVADRRAARGRRRRRPRRRPSAGRRSTCARAIARAADAERARASSRATCGRPSPRCTTRRSRAEHISAIVSVVADALVRRLHRPRRRGRGRAAGAVRVARAREHRPPRGASVELRRRLRDRLGRRRRRPGDARLHAARRRAASSTGLAACGLPSDPKGATAAHRALRALARRVGRRDRRAGWTTRRRRRR